MTGEPNQWLDVRTLARELKLQQAELVRQLQADGVPLFRVTQRRWRIESQDVKRWLDSRRQQAAEDAEQVRLRRGYVAGRTNESPPNSPTPRFQR